MSFNLLCIILRHILTECGVVFEEMIEEMNLKHIVDACVTGDQVEIDH